MIVRHLGVHFTYIHTRAKLKGTWKHFKEALCTKCSRKEDIHRKFFKSLFKATAWRGAKLLNLTKFLGKDLALHRDT